LISLAFVTTNIIFGQNTLISQGIFFEGEPSIAINPTNSQHLIAAWMGTQAGEKIVIKSSVSFNGGVSWSAPIWQPHLFSGNSSADVSLGFDHSGNAFMCYIDYDNVGFSQGQVVVRKSLNGGVSWGNATEVISMNDCPNKLCIDRPWMVIDASGSSNPSSIFVTSVNANQPTMVNPPFNPYLTVSLDGGATFGTPRLVDTLSYLAGNSISQPVATPAIDGNGSFYAMYPSYETSQSPFPRQILSYSDNNGSGVAHVISYQGLNIGVSNSSLKRAGKLSADKSHTGHLAFCFLSELNDQADVYMMESFDNGNSWSSMSRVNQDPIATPRVQDLVWSDFNENGDFLVTWRDRRNATADGYEQPSEIYAALKPFGGNFMADYPISSQAVAFDSILNESGNDFMSVVFRGDTAYAVWGDVRTGSLKIYLNKWHVQTQTSTISVIYEDEDVLIYPNPVKDVLCLPEHLTLPLTISIYGLDGILIKTISASNDYKIDVSTLKTGSYIVEFIQEKQKIRRKFVVE